MEELTAFVSKSFEKKTKESRKDNVSYREVLESDLASSRDFGSTEPNLKGITDTSQHCPIYLFKENLELDKEQIEDIKSKRANEGKLISQLL